MKRTVVALAALVAVLALGACSSGGGSSVSAEPSSTSSVSESASSSSAAAAAEGVVTIALDYNAGTGYEWKSTVEPEGLVAQVGQENKSMTADERISGEPLQDRFTFRAQAPGEVVITFDLVRSWEDGEPAETQVYAFTISDDLNMVLNPYKSDFVNEPEWGSNS